MWGNGDDGLFVTTAGKRAVQSGVVVVVLVIGRDPGVEILNCAVAPVDGVVSRG